jgi:trimethylamine:corrinoid methyltransferase-like protein
MVRFMRQEYFRPSVADRQNREAWEAAGAPDGRERARRLAKRILETHRPVAIDPAVDGEIRKRFTILPLGLSRELNDSLRTQFPGISP